MVKNSKRPREKPSDRAFRLIRRQLKNSGKTPQNGMLAYFLYFGAIIYLKFFTQKKHTFQTFSYLCPQFGEKSGLMKALTIISR